jgi:hypothetical protein
MRHGSSACRMFLVAGSPHRPRVEGALRVHGGDVPCITWDKSGRISPGQWAMHWKAYMRSCCCYCCLGLLEETRRPGRLRRRVPFPCAGDLLPAARSSAPALAGVLADLSRQALRCRFPKLTALPGLLLAPSLPWGGGGLRLRSVRRTLTLGAAALLLPAVVLKVPAVSASELAPIAVCLIVARGGFRAQPLAIPL